MLKQIFNNILHIKIKDLKLKSNLWETIKFGVILILLSILSIILNGFLFAWNSNLISKYHSYELIFLVLRIFLFATIEELIFRVIIQKSIYDATKKNKKDAIITIIVSSIIFSLFHLVNTVSDYSKSEIIMQMWSTCIAGIYLGSIYLKTENWLGCAIIHTIHNISVGIVCSLEGEVSNVVLYNITNVFNNIEEILLLISSIYILKTIKLPKESEDLKNET